MSHIQFEGESAEYRAARDRLVEAETALRAQIEEVAALRRKLPLGRVAEDYVFEGAEGPVRLSELFADGKDSLLLYSYMFGPEAEAPCPMCTCFLDGADGYVPHLEQRLNFAVVARAPYARFARLAEGRGWQNVRLLSAADNTYANDYFSETPDGAQLPLANVFVRRDDGIHHFWATEMFFAPSEFHPRHVDMLWPLWHFLDLTPEGRGDFMPGLKY